MNTHGTGLHRLALAALLIGAVSSAAGQTDIAGGNVNGVWTKTGSPYHINGEITVPTGETLTIEPGVKVEFSGHYKFNIQGRLLAIGSAQDTISFTAQDHLTGWHGIRFNNTPSTNDSSKLIFCKLEYGNANTGNYDEQSGGALFVLNFHKLLVSNCLMQFNANSGIPDYTGGGAVCFYTSSSILTHCRIAHNTGTTGGGILCWMFADATISDNVIEDNIGFDGGGMYVGYSNPLLLNNLVVYNRNSDNGGGIRCHASHPAIINTTIAKNRSGTGGGLDCYNGSSPVIFNSILYGNAALQGDQVNIGDANSDPTFRYCDIEGGPDGFEGEGAGENYNGVYAQNIDSDPLFQDISGGNFHLGRSSPCIGAGGDTIQVGSTWYKAPAFDEEGNVRPNPVGTPPDIGALEHPQGTATSVGFDGGKRFPEEIILFPNYPNPFNPSTVIRYAVWRACEVRLAVYDVLGREVAVLVDGKSDPGVHEVTFELAGLSSGMYVCRIQAGNYTQSRKIVCLR
jgi:hypothetical protein